MNLGGTRFWAAIVLLVATALFLASRAGSENLPSRTPVAKFPTEVGDWRGVVNPIRDDVLEILGKGEFASRYFSRRPGEPAIDFFLAYFPSQRTGDTLHSPQNCLPGAGWAPVEHTRIALDVGGGRQIAANRYVIAKGLDRQVALYWYQAHGRTVASEYAAKIYLVADAIRLNRTDGALARIITPVGRNEPIENAEARAREFAREVAPLLFRFVPE